MKTMLKLRGGGKRLSIGSWSALFSKNSTSNTQSKRTSRGFASTTTSKMPAAVEAASSVAPVNEAKPSTSTLIELAATITRETEKLDKYMRDNGLPPVSFDISSPPNFPKLSDEAKRSRDIVMQATKDLSELVTGPTESVRWMSWDHNNSLSLHAIYHYKIAQSFPVDGTATFGEIAEKVGLDEVNVTRLLRHAMTNRIFKEIEDGVVAHTPKSRVLAEDKAMDDWVGFCVEDMWPAAALTIPALLKNPSASEATQTGFCLANSTTDIEPMFVTFGKSPSRAKRFGGAMVSLTTGEGYELSYLLDNYDWASLDANSSTLVDIGGSHGFVCVALAERFPNMKFVVQDLQKTIASAPPLEGDLAERIKFMAHDFHTLQPVKGADVYFYRWILHNHSDKYAVNMLRQLIPALKKGAKVLINDYCLPETSVEGAGGSRADDKIMRTMDLVMLTLLNAQERTERQYRELFEKVDPRFKFLGVKRVEGYKMSTVEAVWEGDDFGGES